MNIEFRSMFSEFMQSPIRVVLLFLFLFLFPFPHFGEGLIIEPLSDAAHLLLGFLIFYFIKSLGPKFKIFAQDESFFSVAALLISLGLAGYVEYIQPYFGRGFSFHDMELSLFGSFCGFFLLEKKQKNYYIYFIISLTIGLLLAILPIVDGINLARQKWSQFPILVKSNSILNETIKPVYGVELENEIGPCAVLFKTSSLFDGISIPRGREDWSNYDELSIELDSLTNETSKIGLRVDDAIQSKKYDDRYNDKFGVDPGLNKIVVNLKDMKNSVQKREFELKKIRRIFLFSVEDNKPISICVRKIELKNSAS